MADGIRQGQLPPLVEPLRAEGKPQPLEIEQDVRIHRALGGRGGAENLRTLAEPFPRGLADLLGAILGARDGLGVIQISLTDRRGEGVVGLPKRLIKRRLGRFRRRCGKHGPHNRKGGINQKTTTFHHATKPITIRQVRQPSDARELCDGASSGERKKIIRNRQPANASAGSGRGHGCK